MTNVEFCYWLQGSLEVMQNEFFDAQKVQKIKSHLAMVALYDKTVQSKSSPYMSFCDWLRGYLEGSNASEQGVASQRIAEYLFNLFDHAVPPLQKEEPWPKVSVSSPPKMQLNPAEVSELVRC